MQTVNYTFVNMLLQVMNSRYKNIIGDFGPDSKYLSQLKATRSVSFIFITDTTIAGWYDFYWAQQNATGRIDTWIVEYIQLRKNLFALTIRGSKGKKRQSSCVCVYDTTTKELTWKEESDFHDLPLLLKIRLYWILWWPIICITSAILGTCAYWFYNLFLK
jgi:hypothetical protein